VAQEDLLATKTETPNSKNVQRRKPATIMQVPPTPTLITPPSNGTGSTPPTGEVTQGPSPLDYGLELKAVFSLEMVLEMQENVIRKAHRTVVRRTLGERTTIKVLHNCLKLHLPTSFISTTLLTRGYFEILFQDEEGTKATRNSCSIGGREHEFVKICWSTRMCLTRS